MSYQAVTLAELLGQLSFRTEGNPWWTSEQARLAINEGLRIWNAATGFWTTKIYVPVVPNDPYVALPNSICQATRLLWNAIPLEKASLADLDYGIPNWRGATTASGDPHPPRPSYWAPVSLTLAVVYPADATPTAAVPMTLEAAGVINTPVLTLAGDFVDLGQEQHDLLLGYALHVLSFSIGGQRLVSTYPGWVNFLQAAAAENKQFAASGWYRRLLGLDAQRWLRRQERPVTNPVDSVIAQINQQGSSND